MTCKPIEYKGLQRYTSLQRVYKFTESIQVYSLVEKSSLIIEKINRAKFKIKQYAFSSAKIQLSENFIFIVNILTMLWWIRRYIFIYSIFSQIMVWWIRRYIFISSIFLQIMLWWIRRSHRLCCDESEDTSLSAQYSHR